MKYILLTILGLLYTLSAQAQILSVKVKVSKKVYVAHESVHATLTITNRGAEPVVLRDKGAQRWLDFTTTRNGGSRVIMEKSSFGAMKIGARQTMSRKVTLSSVIPLSVQGNYTIRAVVNNGGVSISSGAAFFDVVGGVPIYQKQHGIRGRHGKIVEYRVLVLNSIHGSELYFQNYDPKKKAIGVTYSVGKYLGINKPTFMADGAGHFHMLFQIDAKHHRYMKFNDRGRVVRQKIFKQASQGVPSLIAANGVVDVRNGIEFDAEEIAKKRRAIHNISQRPPFAY